VDFKFSWSYLIESWSKHMTALKKSETLWNKEIRRRCEVVNIAEKVREEIQARLRWTQNKR
jgi:hypothetical protein